MLLKLHVYSVKYVSFPHMNLNIGQYLQVFLLPKPWLNLFCIHDSKRLKLLR